MRTFLMICLVLSGCSALQPTAHNKCRDVVVDGVRAYVAVFNAGHVQGAHKVHLVYDAYRNKYLNDPAKASADLEALYAALAAPASQTQGIADVPPEAVAETTSGVCPPPPPWRELCAHGAACEF